MDRPEEGFYLTRLVKNGPLVPVHIWWEVERFDPDDDTQPLDRPPILRCQVGDNPEDYNPYEIWPWCMERITTEEYLARMRQIRWARRYAPWTPEANPTKPVSLDDIPLGFYKRRGKDTE